MGRTQNKVALYALALLLISCQRQPAKVVAPGAAELARFSQSLAVAEATVSESALTLMELEQAKLFTRAEIAPIMDAIKRVSKGGEQMAHALKSLSTLSETDRQNFTKLVNPMVEAVNEALDRHVTNLGTDAQKRVKVVLVALQSTLSLVQASLVVRHEI